MRSLYESILDIDNDKTIDNKVQLEAYKQEIFDSCECYPDGSSIEIDGNKMYLDLHFHSSLNDCFVDQLANERGLKCLTNVMKNFDIYFCLRNSRDRDFLDVTVSITSKISWNDAVNNAMKLFNNPKWHWCTADHKEIKGKFDCIYKDHSFIHDGEERDYKELCKWFNKNSSRDLYIHLSSTTSTGKATCKNINDAILLYEYGRAVIDLENSQVKEMSVGPTTTIPASFGDGIIPHNVKTKKLVLTSDGCYIDKVARCIFNNIDLDAYPRRGYGDTVGFDRLKNILELEYETIRDNIKDLGNPEVIIKVSRRRSTQVFTLKEYRGKYILKRI